MRAIFRPVLPFPALREETRKLIEAYDGGASFDPDHWRHPRVLGALLALHGLSCAYCQGSLTPSDRGDVEHFRPKSIYWWLAYDFTNYFLSCSRCNRVRKGDRFPLATGEKGLRFGDGRSESDERKLLLDPSRDDIGAIVLRLEGGSWALAARMAAGGPDPRAEETIRLFELNLGLLAVHRQRSIADALEEAQRVRDGRGNPSHLKRLASSFSPFGIFVRRVLAGGGFSDLLPTPRDEVGLLIAELRFELEQLDTTLKPHPKHRDTLDLRESRSWALAVLWLAPPSPVQPAEVAFWIGDRYRPEISRRVDQLRTELRQETSP